MQSTVKASVFRGFTSLVSELGGNPKRVGLSAAYDEFANYEFGVSLLEFMTMLNSAAAETLTPHFGLLFGSRYKRKDLGLIAYLFSYNAQLQDSIDDFRVFFGALQTNSHYKFDIVGDEAIIEYLVFGEDPNFKAQDAEFSIMLHIRCLQFSLGEKWAPDLIEFEHMPIAKLETYSEFLRCEVKFNAPANKIRFSKKKLTTPNPDSDIVMVTLIKKALYEERREAERSIDLVAATRSIITDHMRLELPVTREGVAQNLGLSDGSFTYNLKKEGKKFRQLFNEIRIDTAKNLLRSSSLSISEIAARLGYSEHCAFTRTFKLQTGLTPQKYRITFA